MVGFKSLSTLIILLLFAACVPQVKQTQCKSSEAFNAALRTCVPVMGGASSFIQIDSFIPTSTLTKYKNDTTPVTLSVTISNPYAQAHTVVWERIFNGVPVLINPDTPTSYSFAPSSLASEIGTHIISVKVKDSAQNIVSSHSFEIKINDNPRPIIDSGSILPTSYGISFTPSDAIYNFKFTVKNNGAAMSPGQYRTEWFVYFGGIQLATASNTFPTPAAFPTPAGDLAPTGRNYATFGFDPALYVSQRGVGNYLVRAHVTNTAAEVVAEQQWSVNISHPPLAKVTSRNLYRASASPSFTTVTIAYNGVPYTISPTYNFIPVGQTAQPDYCVTVSSGAGSYPGDGKNVRVDFYLDGVASAQVYSGLTTDGLGGNIVCLKDSVNLSAVSFTNLTNTANQTHKIVARVIDEATNMEYKVSDLDPSLGDTYPITWDVLVKPSNAAPTVTFTADSNLANVTCGVASATARTCTVRQDQSFTVGIKAVDDFYSTSSTDDTIQNKFTYTMILSRNGTAISTCTKTTADVTDTNAPGSDHVGPDYLCAFTVPSFDATGSVNPAAFSYSVAISFADEGSPIGGSLPMAGQILNYNLNVTEYNTSPAIDPQGTTTSDSYLAVSTTPSTVLTGAGFITEGETLNINVLVSDLERDDHQVKVYRCTDITCAVFSLEVLKNVLKNDGVLTTLSSLTYSLPENLIPITTPIGVSVPVYFKIEVTDKPDNAALGLTTATTQAISPIHFVVNVRNRNPAPQFSGTPVPLKTATIKTMVGYPLTIDPGIVTDASVPATEKALTYQWYIDTTGGDDSYVAIAGATAKILKWTPTNGIPAGTTINLAMCASDTTVVNPQPAVGSIGAIIVAAQPANGPNCIGSWDVLVQQNAHGLAFDGSLGSDIAEDIAVWQDTTELGKRVIYTAYTSGELIFVEKTTFDVDGKFYKTAADGFQTVSFPAIDSISAAISTIKDISIAGTNEFLYVAYQAADTSNPGSPKIRIRRIDKRSGVATGSKTDPTYRHPGKFGFNYLQNLPTTDSANITIDPVIPGQPYSVTFNGIINAGQNITVQGLALIAVNGLGPICSGGAALGCSDNGNATLLANAINNSTLRSLQGITAVSTGDNVKIYGSVGGESADTNVTLANYVVTGKLGKIVTYDNGGAWDWHLPFVDLTTGSTLKQIRVLSGAASATDYLSSATITSSLVYSTIGTVNWFTNDIYGSGMVIGSINTSNIAKIHVFAMGSALPSFSVNLFGGSPVFEKSLRIAAPVPGNTFFYAAAKVLVTVPSTYEWKIGRYTSSLVPSFEETFTARASNPATTTVVDVDHIADVSIEAMPAAVSTQEARLLISSNNGTGNIATLTGDYGLYSVRLRGDNYQLSCESCVPLTYGPQELSPLKRIATTKIDRDMIAGITSGTPVDRDVIFAAFGVDVTATGAVFLPQLGMFNMEIESLSTNSTSRLGTEGYRPPFIGE